jgi:hypothetical protein
VRREIIFKFVLVTRADEEIATIFDATYTHSNLVESDENPIGAGDMRDGKLNWGSHSFMLHFGFEKPTEEEIANKHLLDLNVEIDKLVEEYCGKFICTPHL